jgi:DNA mismatch repair protein MutL
VPVPIHRLSQSLINKIAAGEVIERPGSVAKELLENAIDARATRIDVVVENGGLTLVRVADNGGGIPAEELPLAVAPHATSKLETADDLFRVGTLGFRGEALASMGEVSRLVLRSRPAASHGGAEIEVTAGTAGEVVPCGCAVGTAVEVHNLFFNTPVRRKFLRTPQTELGHVSEAVVRLALATVGVHFTLRHNERAVLDLPACGGLPERVAAIFGRELAEHLIWVERSDGPLRLSGCVAHPAQSRSNNRMQYFFLNGRHIRDHALQHALGEAYRGLLMTGRCPIAFLSIEMPPELVDVNVHPTKLEVRFQDAGRMYSHMLATLRSKFLTSDLSTQLQPAAGDARPDAESDPQAEQARQELVNWAKSKVASWQPTGDAPLPAPRPEAGQTCRDQFAPDRRPLELTRLDQGGRAGEGGHHTQIHAQFDSAEQTAPRSASQVMQVHNRYLVTETDEGITIIDQHALHERILFEQLQARLSGGALETQNLLVPEPVDLGPTEAAAALEHREVLAALGIRVEPFGGDTVLLAGFPAMLANMNPVEVFHAVLERLLGGGLKPDRRELLDDLLHTIACKAAIKAGDRLSPGEITALLEQRHLVDDAHHCPHGRPTSLVFTREELDKQFKRI